MSINVGSLAISNETANWLKVRAAISDSSLRATVAKIIERQVSHSKSKWYDDLTVAAAERDMSVEELWTLIVEGKGTIVLPQPSNPKAAIKALTEQAESGRMYDKKRKLENNDDNDE